MSTTKTFVAPRTIVPIPDHVKDRLKIESGRERSRYIHMLISAVGGQGKTAFIGTASKRVIIDGVETTPYNNLLVVEYDAQGEDTLFDMQVEYDLKKPETMLELENLVQWLHTNEAEQYDVVAIDAYNAMSDVQYDTVLEVGKKLKSSSTHDEEILELRDYNRFYKRLRVLNKKILALKKHVIITCISQLKDKPSEMAKKKDDRQQIQSLMVEGKMAHLLSTQFSLHGINPMYFRRRFYKTKG